GAGRCVLVCRQRYGRVPLRRSRRYLAAGASLAARPKWILSAGCSGTDTLLAFYGWLLKKPASSGYVDSSTFDVLWHVPAPRASVVGTRGAGRAGPGSDQSGA